MQGHAPSYRLAACVVPALALAACSTPFEPGAADALHHAVIDAVRRDLEGAPEPRALDREVEDLDVTEERRAELDAMGGPDAYPQRPTDVGADLLGDESQATVALTLEEAILAAADNNLAIASARLLPAIGTAELEAARSVFDWVLFADADWTSTDVPSPRPIIGGVPVGTSGTQAQSVGGDAGLRRLFTSGGTLALTTGLRYTDNETPDTSFDPDPSNEADLAARIDQPLLRGFGTDVNLTEVRLAENLERSSVEELRRTLLDTLFAVEDAYWRLLSARRILQIRRRVVERGIVVRDIAESRLDFDVRRSDYTDAVAQVETRRSDVILAENALRSTSDELKALLNDDRFPLVGEALLLPVDREAEQAIVVGLLDALVTALERRPEVEQALLGIEDSDIRLALADNARLPQLDLAAQLSLAGLDDQVGGAYDDIFDGQFISYLLALSFERQLGNRFAEARFEQSRLERVGSLTAYRQTVQDVVLDVKGALRNLETAYELIQQTRTARRAAAENLRVIEVQSTTIASYTPEFLDFWLRRQEARAAAEVLEANALAGYNVAIAQYHRATGTLLEQHGIRFVVPRAEDLLPDRGR